jgi:regulator of cell morphogenesis and NO signaling
LSDVQQRLSECDERPATAEAEADWTAAPLANLINHIVGIHHRYLRSELPRLQRLFERVVAAHAASHPELAEAQQVFAALHQELDSHMWKEEHVLFPWVVMLESRDTMQNHPCGSVNNPIRVMEHEHRDAAEALERLRQLTSDYQAPRDACPTYQALLAGLLELEHDLHRHIHKENNILFPRAAALEAAL